MEFGLITFADMAIGEAKDNGKIAHKRIKELLEEISLADRLGLDVFGIGEHHRPDYAVSAPAILLAAAAMVTKKIKLSSAVTVLSSDDPVKVFQDFAEIDLISDGRAEIMAGRGSFIESFPLFGYDLEDYNELFTEKLGLLLAINEKEIVNWKGKLRPSIDNLGVYPRPLQPKIPIWLAAGGTPESAVRAATLDLPLMLAIIGGSPQQFVPFINLYKNTALQKGKSLNEIQLGVNNHMYVKEDGDKARNDYFPYYFNMMSKIGRERGWPPLSREHYERLCGPQGALMVGSIEEVANKIVLEHKLFGFSRFMAQASIGTVPHEMTLRSIELFASRVIPMVKKMIAEKTIEN